MSTKRREVLRSTAHLPFRHGLLNLSMVTVFLLPGCSGSITGTVASGDSPPEEGDDFIGGGGGQVGAKDACAADPSVSKGKWRRLTAAQYSNTVKDLLGIAADTSGLLQDGRTGPFKTNALLSIDERDVNTYDTMAQTIATKAVSKLSTLVACDVKAQGEDKCATAFVKSFGARAFRRPLTPAEEGGLTSVYNAGKSENFSTGIKLVVQALLSSSSFLYLVENGSPSSFGLRKLSGHEIASRLSYTLTGTTPDSDTTAAAANGQLDSISGIRKSAQKLMDSERFLTSAATFHIELLGIDRVLDPAVGKGPGFPDFNAEMRAAMAEEPRKFVTRVMTKGQGSVEEMLSARFVAASGPLAKVYGAQWKPDNEGMAEITDGSRTGILTLAGMQATHPVTLSPRGAVARGHVVRESILCDEVPPVTGPVDFSLPPGAEKMTAQQLLRQHQQDPSCSGCHRLMDSIGFAFEAYDPVGALRSKDASGNSIDTSGTLVSLEDDSEVTFSNASEMASALSKSSKVRACMATQWLKFSLGHDPESDDACSQQRVTAVLARGQGSIKDALLSLVTSDSFRFYRGE